MQEVLQKVNELITLLETKIKAVDRYKSLISNKEQDLKTISIKQDAAANYLSARERVLKKYEDLDAAIIKFNNEKVDYNKEIEASKIREANDEKKLKEIQDGIDELDAKKKVLCKQAVVLKEKEVALKVKQDNLAKAIKGIN